jgi:cell division septum initiation protein DivIVA
MSEAGAPFESALRGYQRAQVDAHLEAVERLLARLEERLQQVDERMRALPAEPERRELSDFGALGERVAMILDLAQEEADERLRRVDGDAEAIIDDARARAVDVRREAEAEAEDLRAQVQGAREEAERIRAGARQEADGLLQRARQRAEEHAERVVTQAETQARRVLDAAAESTRQQEEEWAARKSEYETTIASLEERHNRILRNLAQLRASLDADPDVVAAAAQSDARPGAEAAEPEDADQAVTT